MKTNTNTDLTRIKKLIKLLSNYTVNESIPNLEYELIKIPELETNNHNWNCQRRTQREDLIKLCTKGAYKFTITANEGQSTYSIIVDESDANELRPLLGLQPITGIECTPELKTALKIAANHCQVDSCSPYKEYIQVTIQDNQCTIIATDAYRLYKSQPIQTTLPNDKFYINFKNVPKITALIPSQFIRRDIEYKSSEQINTVIQGAFNDAKAITFNASDFIETLKTVKTAANKTTNQVVLTVKNNTAKLSSQDIDYGYHSELSIPCQSDSEITIAFNGKYMESLTKGLTDKITIQASAPNRCMIVNDNSLLYPQLLNN